MTTTSVSLPRAHGMPTLDRVTFGLLLAFVASLQMSIAVANILLTATLICWASILVRERERPLAPTFYWPLLGYAALTLVAAAASFDARTSFIDCKQLLLFLIV